MINYPPPREYVIRPSVQAERPMYLLPPKVGTFIRAVGTLSANVFPISPAIKQPITISSAPILRPEPNEDELLATLPLVQRWRRLLSHDKAYSIVALIVAIASLGNIIGLLVRQFILPAHGAESSPITEAQEGIQPYVQDLIIAVLAIGFFWCLAIVSFSGTASKITFAKETSRNLVSGLLGFMAGRVVK